jgi:hypothetical protein
MLYCRCVAGPNERKNEFDSAATSDCLLELTLACAGLESLASGARPVSLAAAVFARCQLSAALLGSTRASTI